MDVPATQGADPHINIQVPHTEGLVRLKHAPKGSKTPWLFTGGEDYLVRLLPADVKGSNVEPLLIDDATGSITWVDADRDYLVTASADGCVRIYQHAASSDDSSPTDLVAILTRTSLTPRCAALERFVAPGKTPRVAVCSDELIIKIVDAGAPTRVQTITKHAKSARAASWSPTEALLVTCDCDGMARVWDMAGVEPVEVKAVLGVLPSSRANSEHSVEAHWHPSGTYFVLPGKAHELVVISAPNWTRTATFLAPATGEAAAGVTAPSGEIVSMAFSPNGRYLASATSKGDVTIWETSTRRAIRSRKADGLVTGLSWHPEADALAWVDSMGQLTRWSGVVGASMPSPCESISFAKQHKSSTAAAKASEDDFDDIFGDIGMDDDDFGDEGQTLADKLGIIDDEAGDDDGGRSSKRRRGQEDEDDDGDDGIDDFVVDDLGTGDYASAFATERNGGGGGVRNKRSRFGGAGAASTGALVRSTQAQPAFQPTSTEMKAQRRYLAFTMLGSLVATDQDDHQTIAFESYDASARRNWRFVDHFRYTMASLGGTGALFACVDQPGMRTSGDDEDGENTGHPSSIYFKPFEAAGAWTVPGTEWSASLPPGEIATAVAMAGRPAKSASEDAAAATTSPVDIATAIVATSAGYLRFFSASGLQRYVWAFGAPIVTMAAGARSVLVVHRATAGGALDGFQNLSYTLIDLLTFGVRQQGTLPLGKDVQLRWAGFNDLEMPAVYDSKGVLYVLDRAHATHGQARWVPTLETANMAKSKTDDGVSPRLHYWPVGLTNSKLLTLILKGHAVPDAAAQTRPLIQEFELTLPLLGVDTPAGQLEQEHMRNVFIADAVRASRRARADDAGEEEMDVEDDAPEPLLLETSADKALLQLIQLACKSDKHARALDAARELHSTKTLDAALQIATFFHQPSLAERISALREWVEQRAERDALRGATVVLAPTADPAPRRAVDAMFDSTPRSAAAAARRALASDFAPAPRRSYGRSGLAALAEPPASRTSSAWPDSSGLGDESISSNRAAVASSFDFTSDKENSEGEERSVSPDATRRGDKRKSSATFDEDDEPRDKPVPKIFAKPTAPASAAPRNPFARQPGMTRDRSMHKSTSFFERVDAVEGNSASNGGGAAAATASKPKKQKQTTLFGLPAPVPKEKEKSKRGRKPASAAAAAAPAATPAFGETQESQPEGAEEDEESLRATLNAVRRESQVQLEETQAVPMDDDDEETQLKEHETQFEQQEEEDAQMQDAASQSLVDASMASMVPPV